jgi:hypothetical protein
MLLEFWGDQTMILILSPYFACKKMGGRPAKQGAVGLVVYIKVNGSRFKRDPFFIT